MQFTARRGAGVAAKIGTTLALIVLAEALFDGSAIGSVIGGFALAWLAALLLIRRAVLRDAAARMAAVCAAAFGLVLIDDPSLLAWVLFWTAISLAALLPRARFDDALTWAWRLARHGLLAVATPVRDAARIGAIRQRRGGGATGVRAAAALLAMPLVGGAAFVALFASANPLIEAALARLALPSPWTVFWRALLAMLILVSVWASLRPRMRPSRAAGDRRLVPRVSWTPGVATLILSLVTFNAIFAIENILDIAFLWSGAALPVGVTMADYAHRGAYSLILTALLAGVFVLVALRPGGAGAASPAVRRSVTLWIVQNLLLVASSILRTLDYVDAYGMTVLRLAALAWMGLVAVGLVLIGWRLLANRSAAWLVNANALAAAIVLAGASVVDLGATAAAWNVRVYAGQGSGGPPIDLCYMASLGSSSLVSLARLERRVREPGLRDRVAYLRWRIQLRTALAQENWRSWTPRDARRLDTVRAMAGTRPPSLHSAPYGRGCDGTLVPPPPVQAPKPLTAPKSLTGAVQR